MASDIQSQNHSYDNRLTFLRRVTPIGTRVHRGIFRCLCGKEIEALEGNVRRGHTKSCGCLNYEMLKARRGTAASHGHFINGHPSKTYVSWQAMIARCTNPKHPAFERYQKIGVRVCERWLNSFDAFLADMGERPVGKTLDRFPNNNGDYEVENCRWATPREQGRNMRTNIRHEFNGQMLTLAEIVVASACDLPINTIRGRMRKGMYLIEALTTERYEALRQPRGSRLQRKLAILPTLRGV